MGAAIARGLSGESDWLGGKAGQLTAGKWNDSSGDSSGEKIPGSLVVGDKEAGDRGKSQVVSCICLQDPLSRGEGFAFIRFLDVDESGGARRLADFTTLPVAGRSRISGKSSSS